MPIILGCETKTVFKLTYMTKIILESNNPAFLESGGKPENIQVHRKNINTPFTKTGPSQVQSSYIGSGQIKSSQILYPQSNQSNPFQSNNLNFSFYGPHLQTPFASRDHVLGFTLITFKTTPSIL